VERAIQARGGSVREASLDEMEAEWQRVKQDEPMPGGRETSAPRPAGRRSAP
jgi:hypothetical protein